MFLCTIEPLILTGKLLLTALKTVISSPKFTDFVTISNKNNCDSLYFHKKVHKKTLDLLKFTQNPPFPLTQCPQCQAAKTRNEQTNLQPTLNKGRGGVSLFFFTKCRYMICVIITINNKK